MATAFVHPREGLSPYAGGKLYFYDPGTTSARNVYQDADLTSLHAQPVIANAAGVFPAIYLRTGTYKVRLETSANVLVYEQDNVDSGVSSGPGALPIASGGTDATNAIAARANLGAAAATDLTAAQSAVSVIQSQIAGSLTAGNTRLGLISARNSIRAVDLDPTNFGQLVAQRFFDPILGQQTTSAVIPFDNTIPQSGEGTQLWSRSIIPRFAGSVIVVRGHFLVGGTATQVVAFAMFDGGANALAVAANISGSTLLTTCSLIHEIPSWGTTAKTLSIRFGPNLGTAVLNGNGGSVNYGNNLLSSVELLEFKGGPF